MVEQLFRRNSFSSGTLPLPPSLQTFCRYFYNTLDTFAPKIKLSCY